MKIMTTSKLVGAIRAQDNSTAINENMLRALFYENKVTSWKHGNRTVCEFGILIEGINKLLGLKDTEVIPRLRSIHDAFTELRRTIPELGVSEERIRFLVSVNKLSHIKVGNRAYIALESFEAPYNSCLIYDDYRESKVARQEEIAQKQIDETLGRRANRKK